MNIDPYILAFSAVTVIVTIWMGFRSARTSKTASDFFVAGRSVSVGWNASAISGEYLSAASFMGVAGMVMSVGYDALWYPVCYACGYLFLLLFIAGPLRRFGAYTVPDLAEGRFDSPMFRKIAVVFVLFIGFFYTMPQMKGAGTTLAYIFPGLPYWAGVVLVGAVITLNVALGGMKGITLVQAFQYWAKMFAISVPIFVLMAVYGHYGKQVGVNGAMKGSGVGELEPKSKLLVDRIKQGPPAQQGSSVEPNGMTDYDRSGNGLNYAVFNDTKGDFGSQALRWAVTNQNVRETVNAALGNEGYGFGAQVPVLRYGAALQLLAQMNGWRIATFEPRSELSFNIASYGTRNAFRDGLSSQFTTNGITIERLGGDDYLAFPTAERSVYLPVMSHLTGASEARQPLPAKAPADATWLNPFGPLTTKAAKAAKLSPEESKPYSLLYTYSLIIAIVCGTAGLPHILVRFYTNPDGVAAKRTTMWVMILIGVFYVFPPVFGVMGRNLFPELYNGVGAKGTDKIVLELPRLLNEKYAPLGSILSGVTCAGAFAAFMSTFSGLLVSMTGAMAHDVYGRMINPKANNAQRLRAFKFAAVIVGGVAIVLGTQVEALDINFMVGQAFAIAAASYFPFLFMCAWWRKLTMKGAATGMLTGGLLALVGITLTSVSDIALKTSAAKGTANPLQNLQDFWAGHPAIRIICEQPAIWAVPLAIGLMILVSKLTSRDVPEDIRMKMLVLHAPEKLGLKQEYIQEHQHGH